MLAVLLKLSFAVAMFCLFSRIYTTTVEHSIINNTIPRTTLISLNFSFIKSSLCRDLSALLQKTFEKQEIWRIL
jgi:hypothetical protein